MIGQLESQDLRRRRSSTGRRRPALALLGAILWGGCAEASLTHLSWPEIGADEVGFLLLSERGMITSQRGPFTVASHAMPIRELLYEGTELRFLVLKLSRLRTLEPAFDADRSSEIRFEARSQDCSSVLHRSGVRVLPLDDENTRAFVLDGDALSPMSAVELGLSAALPASEDLCFRGAAPRLRAFGAMESLWPPGSPLGSEVSADADPVGLRNLLGAVELGSGRLAVHSGQILAVVESGRDWENHPSRYWELLAHQPPAEGTTNWGIQRVLVDERRSTEAQKVLLVLVSLNEARIGDTRSAVFEVPWTPAGFGETRLRLSWEPALHALGSLADGRLFVIGEEGTVLLEAEPEGVFEPVPGLGLGQARLRDWAAGPSPAEPLAFLTTGSDLLFGAIDPASAFRVESSPSIAPGARRLTGLLRPDGSWYFSTTEYSDLLTRWPDGRRVRADVPVPEELWACASPADACGRRFLGSRPILLVPRPGESLVVALRGCNAAIELDPASSCVRAISAPGPVMEARSNWHVAGGALVSDGLVLIGEEGRVLKAEWAAP